jgi:WS/DGAT/MGAT family acyltransferase
MQALSNLDASFLHLEKDNTPMHVGGILHFAQPADGSMTWERFRGHVAARLQTARVFRQRLYIPPALLDKPVWVEDPEFSLDHHVHRHTLIGPLTGAALESLGSKFFSGALRRDRPLWEMLFVQSQRPAQGFAILLKVHHCALDGVSAESVIIGLLDFCPEPRQLPPDSWQPEPLPKLAGVLRQRFQALRQAPAQARELLASTAQLAGVIARRTLSLRDAGMPHYFMAPHTPFNRPVSSERRYCSVQLSLTMIKAIKNTMPGYTVNDVVLAVCAGATRRYLEEGGDLPADSLVAMAPVSRRADGKDKTQAGNKVMAMLVRLATDIADPVGRLRQIHHYARRAKDYSHDVTVDALLDQLPVAAPALVLEAYSRLHLGRHVPPIFNMVITNVPGSPLPLYFDGAPLRSLSGMVCLYDGIALNFVVMSYLDQLSIGITSTREALRNPERLTGYLQEAVLELANVLLPEMREAEAKPAAVAPRPDADASVHASH